MADQPHEKNKTPPDPVAETSDRPRLDEPIGEEKVIADESAKQDGLSGLSGGRDSIPEERTDGAGLDRTKSSVTDASATTAATSRHADSSPKPWYRNYNPMRWGRVRPVPKERTPCPEYKAGFFSQLVFQWMHPLMTVNTLPDPKKEKVAEHWADFAL